MTSVIIRKTGGKAVTIIRGSAAGGIGLATTGKAGAVKPDGSTITVDPDGTIRSTGGGSGGVSKAFTIAMAVAL